jgi:anti-anti-sigma regulatory factor
MNITTQTLKILDLDAVCFQINNPRQLNSDNASELRASINACLDTNYPVIYLDIQDVKEMDLAGVNEIINAHYILQQAAKKLVLLYRKNSVVEEMVKTTALDRFVDTAVIA